MWVCLYIYYSSKIHTHSLTLYFILFFCVFISAATWKFPSIRFIDNNVSGQSNSTFIFSSLHIARSVSGVLIFFSSTKRNEISSPKDFLQTNKRSISSHQIKLKWNRLISSETIKVKNSWSRNSIAKRGKKSIWKLYTQNVKWMPILRQFCVRRNKSNALWQV